MSSLIKTAVVVGACLLLVNFGWQAFTGQHWNVAADRSFFQAAALFILVCFAKK